MKPTFNRWLKIVAWLLAIVIVVMLLLPAEMSDEQLKHIKPGMSVEQVKEQFGPPFAGPCFPTVVTDDGPGLRFTMIAKGKFWHSDVVFSISRGIVLGNDPMRWIGKNHLLWVEHNNGIVVKTWLIPFTRSGGGLQGCIDTIKQYWNDWWK